MPDKHIKLKGIQKIIAQKMSKSKQTIPHVTTVREVRMDRVIERRKDLTEKLSNKVDRISFMTFIIKAVAESIKKFPIINSSLDEEKDEIIIKENVNIGFAVAVEEKLMVPVVKKVQEMEFVELIREVNKITNKSRNNELSRKDLTGGTFTISNSGAFGGEIFTPIINYPESAILGIGKIQKKPVVNENDEIVVRPMMYLCLSYDHRIINGATAVQFLGEVEKNCIDLYFY